MTSRLKELLATRAKLLMQVLQAKLPGLQLDTNQQLRLIFLRELDDHSRGFVQLFAQQLSALY